jgi:hypothetical protein
MTDSTSGDVRVPGACVEDRRLRRGREIRNGRCHPGQSELVAPAACYHERGTARDQSSAGEDDRG